MFETGRENALLQFTEQMISVNKSEWIGFGCIFFFLFVPAAMCNKQHDIHKSCSASISIELERTRWDPNTAGNLIVYLMKFSFQQHKKTHWSWKFPEIYIIIEWPQCMCVCVAWLLCFSLSIDGAFMHWPIEHHVHIIHLTFIARVNKN